MNKIEMLDHETKERRKCRFCTVVFAVSLVVSVALIVAGFLVPPTGEIDGSVLTAVGELIIFPALAFGFRALEYGYDLKMTHGDTVIEVNNDDDDQ